MAELKIIHTHLMGTVLEGTSKGDGTAQILKGLRLGWRWFRDTDGFWYIQGTRDHNHRGYAIDTTVKALTEAGHQVETKIDDTPRPPADVERDRAAQSEARVEALEAKGERLTATGSAQWEDARAMASIIPLGQPLLVDHYSYGRDVRYRAKIDRKEDKAIETLKAGESAAERSVAAEHNQRHHLNGATTERRILKLEAELRGFERRIAERGGDMLTVSGKTVQQWADEVTEQLTYWRAHLATLVESGEYRKYGPEDFKVGDLAKVCGTWHPVLRVNRKTLTVESRFIAGRSGTVPFDDISGHKSAG